MVRLRLRQRPVAEETARVNDRRDEDRTSEASRASRPRSSAADLELELAAIERTLPSPERRASRPAERRRSIPELMAELERLSADIPLRRSSLPAHEPAKPLRAAEATRAPQPSIPPTATDFDDVPAVLGLLDADGRIRSAITPPPPAPAASARARRPSIPPPVPDAARRASIPAPIAPTPVIGDDNTMMTQIDASLLEEIEADDIVELSEESMSEPKPSPLGDAPFASIPRAAAVPGRAREHESDALPDLSDLGEMLEPSAAPPVPAGASGEADHAAADQDESS
jgi:hypothetical protein